MVSSMDAFGIIYFIFKTKMKILFYLGHPAHFHLFRLTIESLKKKNHSVKILIKKKDILEDLLKNCNWEYTNILPKGRKDNLLSISFGLFKRDLALYKNLNKFKPDLMLGTSPEIAHIGRLRNIPSIVVNEDDYKAVFLFSIMSYPFAKHIMAPRSCDVGKWKNKNIQYDGYHELAYLHPNHFSPDITKINKVINTSEKYFIIRFAKLTAHHDVGKSGINKIVANEIINILKDYGNIYITSERKLEPEFEKYRININPIDIHHALYYADMYIGDSQTMTAESAVLGTPALRFNDFVGKLGYLEELEHKYELTYGIKTNYPDKLYNQINNILKIKNLKEEWQKRKQEMLNDKIDVAQFMVWLIENYPDSIASIKNNPDYQSQFISN